MDEHARRHKRRGEKYLTVIIDLTRSFKSELIHGQGPWRDVDHVEIETLTWVGWGTIE